MKLGRVTFDTNRNDNSNRREDISLYIGDKALFPLLIFSLSVMLVLILLTNLIYAAESHATAIVEVKGEEIFEFGQAYINHNWKTIDFNFIFNEPIVIAKPLSYFGSHASHVRLRNVDSEGFEAKVEEWDFLDGWHAYEKLSYFVIEPGVHEFDGKKIQAGKIDYNDFPNAIQIDFPEPFSSVPIVLAQVQSFNGYQAVIVRVSHVSNTGFKVRLQEQELYMRTWDKNYGHTGEIIGWVAFEPGYGEFENIKYEFRGLWGYNQAWKKINFQQEYSNPSFLADIQSYLGIDPAELRYKYLKKDNVKVKVEEERSRDWEIWHAKEKIGYIVLQKAEIPTGNLLDSVKNFLESLF